jgi:hydroxymethylpyrimidine pyrophosphatase-like HAD family hydrolase
MELKNAVNDIKLYIDAEQVKNKIANDLGLKFKNNKCLCFKHSESNPSMSYDPKKKKYLWTVQLDESISDLTAFVRSEFPDVGIELCGFYDSWYLHTTPLSEFYKEYLYENSGFTPHRSASARDIETPLAKVYLYSNSDKMSYLMKALNSQPFAARFELAKSGSETYEIMPKGTTKGNCLLRLADILDVSCHKTIAIGDNENDVSMFRTARIGIAVANASEKAKAKADLVLERTNNEHAIAEVLKKLEQGWLN